MKKIKVTFLGLENSIGSFITGPMDLFYHSGRIWNAINGLAEEPRFDVELVSLDGKPITCHNGIVVNPHRSVFEVKETDLIIISSSSFDIPWTLERYKDTIPFFQDQHSKGVPVASICIGAFLLAETGLLDDKRASTHWGFSNLFEEMYPDVKLERNDTVTDDQNIFTSGGANSGLDLALYLVEKLCGHDTASNLARSFVIEPNRQYQSPFSRFMGRRKHNDDDILHIQKWIESNYNQPFSVTEFSDKLGMSSRNLTRRFSTATGITPVEYIQLTRMEASKIELEKGNHNIQEIALMVGYEDVSFFRKVFKKIVGVSPYQYRQMFKAG
jgi:transcriptional regulator GlxA family with amidase domain